MTSREYYERLWEALPDSLEPSALDLRRTFLLEHARAVQIPDQPTVRVLDVGCGEAHFAAELTGAGFQVIGVDVAEEPLRRARAKHPDLDLRVVPAEGPWPLADGSFDVVWAGE